MQKIVGWTGQYVLPVLLLVGAVYGARRLVASRPEAARQQVADQVMSVEVIHPVQTNHTVVIQAMGQVVPARRVDVRAQVSGQVIDLHEDFEVGGRIPTGTTMIHIEREDYEAALTEAKSVYADRTLAEAMELQRQAIAREELEREGSDLPDGPGRSIALREPQVESARQSRKAALAAVERARRNLARTEVRLPFDAVVLRKDVDAGSVVSTQTMIAEVAAVERFHVEVVLAPQSLAWLPELDAEGRFSGRPAVDVGVARGSDTVWRRGYLSRLLGDMRGNMARVLVAVENPLDAADTAVLLGSHVSLKIPGKELHDVWAIPRKALREDESVLLADDNDSLVIAQPEIVWKDRDMVYFSGGISAEDRFIVTSVGVAAPGMALKIMNGSDEEDDQ